MDIAELLRERLADSRNHQPYLLALSMYGSPLPPGRRLYAIAEVAGVDPERLVEELGASGSARERETLLDAWEAQVRETVTTAVQLPDVSMVAPPARD